MSRCTDSKIHTNASRKCGRSAGKAPGDPAARGGPVGQRGPQNLQNTKTVLWILSDWIPFFSTKRYYGSVL
jgi:hypothetical protein